MDMQSVVNFAANAHRGQVRRGGVETYIQHPLRMYKFLMQTGHTGDTLAVALLHDVVEDTKYTFEDCDFYLQSSEGKEALRLLTKKKGETSGEQLGRILGSENQMAIRVKMYDALDNAVMDEAGRAFTLNVLKRDPDSEIARYKNLAHTLSSFLL